jgi:hypothetical protein
MYFRVFPFPDTGLTRGGGYFRVLTHPCGGVGDVVVASGDTGHEPPQRSDGNRYPSRPREKQPAPVYSFRHDPSLQHDRFPNVAKSSRGGFP